MPSVACFNLWYQSKLKKETEFVLPEIKFANDGFNSSLYCPSEVKGFIDNFFHWEFQRDIWMHDNRLVVSRYLKEWTKVCFQNELWLNKLTHWNLHGAFRHTDLNRLWLTFLRRIEQFLDGGNNHSICDSVTVINTPHCYRKRHSLCTLASKVFNILLFAWTSAAPSRKSGGNPAPRHCGPYKKTQKESKVNAYWVSVSVSKSEHCV